MTAVDTQILFHAHQQEAPFHDRALAHLTELIESGRPWAIPWPCVHEFIAVMTQSRIWKRPATIEEAMAMVASCRQCPDLVWLSEATDHLPVLSDLLIHGRIVGTQTHDARIAAICLSHHVDPLWSSDRDLSRFPRLRVVNPLVA